MRAAQLGPSEARASQWRCIMLGPRVARGGAQEHEVSLYRLPTTWRCQRAPCVRCSHVRVRVVVHNSVRAQAPPKAHVAALPCRHRTRVGTPLTRFVAPSGAPAKAQVSALPCAHRTSFGTPLTRFVAKWGAPAKAPVAALRGAHRTHFGTPLTRFVAPQGAPPKAPVGGSTWRTRVIPIR